VNTPALSLLVLECNDIDKAKDFYERIGLSFVSERHGGGPLHYSATLGSMVLEIYPRKAGAVCGPIRIGFRIAALDAIIERLRLAGARNTREPHESPWGRRAVVEDPDGNRVELAEIAGE
jgi:predicted enzyme related to lactoylglutathione lyase